MRPRVFFGQSFSYKYNYFNRGIWLESSSWMSFDSCIFQYICPVYLSFLIYWYKVVHNIFIILFYMYRICRAIISPILTIGILLFSLINLTSALSIYWLSQLIAFGFMYYSLLIFLLCHLFLFIFWFLLTFSFFSFSFF